MEGEEGVEVSGVWVGRDRQKLCSSKNSFKSPGAGAKFKVTQTTPLSGVPKFYAWARTC